MTQPLICVIPFCGKDTNEAARLLSWIHTLDGQHDYHALLLVADDAVPLDDKKRINALGKSAFTNSEMLTMKCPAPVNNNYHVPAAFMFGKAINHIDAVYKWNFVWVEPDAVPLRSGWLDTLAEGYTACPKRFMGSIAPTDKGGTIMFGTAVYPNCCGPELQKFCDGKTHFDVAMSGFVVPRAQESNLFFHRWGAPGDPPTFKDVKMPADGPNVGTLDIIPKEAVLFHRNKDGTLIELLKSNPHSKPLPNFGIGSMEVIETPAQWKHVATEMQTWKPVSQSDLSEDSGQSCGPIAPKRRGRPPKAKSEPEAATP